MPAPFLPNSNNTVFHSELVSCQQQIRTALETLTVIRSRMVQMISGNDYTVLEAQYGYSAGEGVNVFSQVDTLYQALVVNNGAQSALIDKLNQFLYQVG
jgi:hypothetical protein